MSLSVRLFLSYFLLLGVALWFVMQSFTQEVVPGMRQSLEEVLVDTANLLAEMVGRDLAQGQLQDNDLLQTMDQYLNRSMNAKIGELQRRDPNLDVYITDGQGVVVYDSRGMAEGLDYSQWNDVYLTLRGRYGARTSRFDESDPFSSYMYVAAPILHDDKIIGVLSVSKPSVAVQPFADRAIDKVVEKGSLILLAALALGMVFAYWLSLSLRRLRHYANEVTAGHKIPVPRFREQEMAQLAEAMDTMRNELEGKAYVERYLLDLTHELKSPLAAIRGAVELIDADMPESERERFLQNIHNESERLNTIVERLLNLAALEKRQSLQEIEWIHTQQLCQALIADKQSIWQQKGLHIQNEINKEQHLQGERFLLQQALGNLLDNAIDFSPQGGHIFLQDEVRGDSYIITIRDEGPGIPEYACTRIFERFYSLPRPNGERKGTGLGLGFVEEIVKLHGGRISVQTAKEGGALARLVLPMQKTPVQDLK